MLSPEDLDCADSCSSKEPDTSDTSWNLSALKDALLETRSAQTNSSPHYRDDSTQQSKKINIFSKVDTVEGRNLVKIAIDNNTTDTSIESTEPKSDYSPNPETADDFWSIHKKEDIFLHAYANLRDVQVVSDPEMEFVRQEDLEQPTKDIFKVWDLDIPHEEGDGFIEHVNKTLDRISVISKALVPCDKKLMNCCKDFSGDTDMAQLEQVEPDSPGSDEVETDTPVETDTDKWMKCFTKSCPKCNIRIEKTRGCNKMRCICKFKFCWLCVEPWTKNHKCGVEPSEKTLSKKKKGKGEN